MNELPEVITRYVDALDEAAEDRVLTQPMSWGGIQFGCLIARAEGISNVSQMREDCHARTHLGTAFVGKEFDALCRRHGTAPVADSIRNRIWSNRARRALTKTTVTQTAEAPCSVA